jgi:predicted dehydrogenase
LAGDSEVDIVYVATPHVAHVSDTLTCLDSGKAVLCEKPMGVNAAEVRRMVDRARERSVFLMEAMWTLFFPALAKVREVIASGAIGDIRIVQSNFCFRTGWNPEGRLLNPELAGGSLLDVGVYNVALAHHLLGRNPREIASQAHIGETGVDEQAAMVFRYDDGALAVLTNAVRTRSLHEATIYGTEGMIRLPHLFWQPDRVQVSIGGGEMEDIAFTREGNGYNYEAAAAMACVREGRTESDVMPLDASVAVAETMDRVRAQWGLTYPCEGKEAT